MVSGGRESKGEVAQGLKVAGIADDKGKILVRSRTLSCTDVRESQL